jgi:mRNA interferase MazF
LGETWVQRWEAAGLLKPSAIKPALATLERSLVIRQLGALEVADRSTLRSALSEVLG